MITLTDRFTALYEKTVGGLTDGLDLAETAVATTLKSAAAAKKTLGKTLEGAADVPLAAALIGLGAVMYPQRTASGLLATLEGSALGEHLVNGVENTVDTARMYGNFVAVHAEAAIDLVKPAVQKARYAAADAVEIGVYTAVAVGTIAFVGPIFLVLDVDMDDLNPSP